MICIPAGQISSRDIKKVAVIDEIDNIQTSLSLSLNPSHQPNTTTNFHNGDHTEHLQILSS